MHKNPAYKVVITPAPLSGTIEAIASKSEAHRHLICAALADCPTELRLNGSSEDIDTTANCLRALGAHIAQREQALVVEPVPAGRMSGEATLDCKESGSTLRFMLPVAAACVESAHFVGSGRLPLRPLGELTGAMRQNGVELSGNHLPLTTRGRLQSGTYVLPGNVSSQYVTGLLLALPLLEGASEIVLTTKLESTDYVEITLGVLRRYGIMIGQEKDRFCIPGGQQYRSPGTVAIEGDWSNAAFFLAAGALGAPVTVSGLAPSSAQGDKSIVELLRRFGAEVTVQHESVTVRPRKLRACTIDIGEIPDLLPALAVVAAHAEGATHFTNAARLRLKESDRLKATATLLRLLGGKAEELPEGLIVYGTELTGGCVDSFHDHRIAMAAAVAAIRCAEQVCIFDAGAVSKSYPAFFSAYQALGGEVDVV